MIRFFSASVGPMIRRFACRPRKGASGKAGNILELLGTYNPRSKALTLNEEQVKHWISKGAQPTDSIHNLLINKKVIEGKKVNALPKKTPQNPTSPEATKGAGSEVQRRHPYRQRQK